MKCDLEISEIGNRYCLRREQWGGKEAYISKDSNLLDKVKKYTWTYDGHYLINSKTGKRLHEYVMENIYGLEFINEAKKENYIVEHLNNNGLDCTYENLHILSSDNNKAKAFSIDKKSGSKNLWPSYSIDVYYIHDEKKFKVQIFMNDNILVDENNIPIEMITCTYNDFDYLHIDWLYLLKQQNEGIFDIKKLTSLDIEFKYRPVIHVPSSDKDKVIFKKNGELFLNLNYAHVTHTELRRGDNNEN